MRGLKSQGGDQHVGLIVSHPSRGAWIEILTAADVEPVRHGRTPHGVRGLKYYGSPGGYCRSQSHPSRGAWIEMDMSVMPENAQLGRTPHGVRGLKLVEHRPESTEFGVAPLTGCVD